VSDWILVALLGALAAADTTAFFQGMIHQPLVAATLIGAAFQMPLEGAYFGTLVQLMWLGDLPVGGARFPDIGPVAVGTAAGAMMAIGSGVDLGMAGLGVVVLSLPLGWAAGYLVHVQREFQTAFLPRIMNAINRGRPGRLRWYLLIGIGHSAIRGALVGIVSAVLVNLLLGLLASLPIADQVSPWALLAGMIGIGLAVVLELLESPEALRWLAGGVIAGSLILLIV
jgi:mannose/fructose/N-acetylgalactosamine-specific phosphotransferase system component IIC